MTYTNSRKNTDNSRGLPERFMQKSRQVPQAPAEIGMDEDAGEPALHKGLFRDHNFMPCLDFPLTLSGGFLYARLPFPP